MRHQVTHLHLDAPAKPAPGAVCNGCGVCCASEPCPVGTLVSRRTQGACAALVWREDARAYRCGLVEQPQAHLPRVLAGAAPLLRRLARRMIAAGIGCDCSLEATTASSGPRPNAPARVAAPAAGPAGR